jgi:vitamin B12 transporter
MSRVFRSLLLGASALAGAAPLSALAPGSALAQAPQPVAEIAVTRLPARVTVTPGAYVVDRAAIEARGAVFAGDALAAVPGLSVFRNGAFGGVTSVRQRGASADKTLVLIDGVPANDAAQPDGNYDFRSLDLADIDRIEVLNGPQGSLWGSDAIGGVIAFTTREMDGARASLEAGAHQTLRGSAGVGAVGDRYAVGLSASGLRTDGISKADRHDGATEDDGFRTGTIGGYARFRPADMVEIEGRLRFNAARAEVDGFGCVANCADADFNNDVYALTDTADVSRSESWSGLARMRIDGPLGFRQTLGFDGYRQDRRDFGPYVTTRNVYRWNASRGAPADPFGLLVGVEHADTRAELGSGEAADLGLTSAFAVGRVRPTEPLTLTGSVRLDDPKGAKSQASVRAAAAWTLPAGLTVAASYGEGFKVPTVSQIVCDFCYPAGPSTGLRPERARGYDLGLSWRAADGRMGGSVTAYRLSVRDQIAYTSGRYRNIARTLSRGIEAQAEALLGGGFRVAGAYAYTEAEDRATSLQLLRAPTHSGSATLAWTGRRLEGALSVRAESDQADTARDGFSRARRDGFVVADMTAGFNVTEAVKLTLRIENLTDRRYQQVLGYGETGRSAYAGVALRY